MSNLREIVNGALLQQFVNKKVSILGHAEDVSDNGMSFKLRAVDNTLVQVNLKSPLDQPLEGYIEVRGTSQGKSIMADDFTIFNNTTIDAEAHNSLCTLLQSAPQLWAVK